MSFTVTLYKTTSAKNKIQKSLSQVASYTGTAKEELDQMNPTISLNIGSIPDANYAYISATNKYYYAKFRAENNGLIRAILTEDPLMSHASEILSCNVLIDRRENGGDRYIDNGIFIPTSETATQVIEFSNGFLEDPVNILITAGGN